MTLVSELKTQIDSLFVYVTDSALDVALGSSLPFVGDAFSSILTGGMPLLGSLTAAVDAKLDAIDSLTDPTAIAAALDALDNIEASAALGVITIHIGAADTYTTPDTTFGLKVGAEALGFTINGSANLKLGYTLDLGVAFDTGTHFLTTATGGGHEIALTLDGNLDLHGKGGLGFVNITFDDKLPTPELALKFALDIDSGIKASALDASSVAASISGAANLDLGIKTDLSTKILPTLYTDLIVKYEINDFNPATGGIGLGTTPTIALQNIELDLGSFVDFLAGVFGPFIHEVFGSFPLGPLIDVVTTPLPIIDPATRALGLTKVFDIIGHDGIVNLLDIAAHAGADKEILDNFALAFGLIKGISESDGKGGVDRIKLGDLVIIGDAPTDSATMLGAKTVEQLDGNGSTFTPGPNPFAAAIDGLKDELSGVPDQKPGLGGVLKPLIEALSSVGLSIPLLTKPESIVPLLLNHFPGQPTVDLITYDVPKLYYLARYDQFFPIVGPIGLAFGGQFSAGIDIDFGYDTKGIQTGNFADGFFLSTPLLAGSLTDHAPAATLGVEIDAAAAINIGIAEVAVGGGLAANLSAYFPGADGKLRLSDIGDGCLFDPIAGEFDATVFVRFSINFVIFQWSHRFDIADVTLAEFEFGCHPPSTDDPAHEGLATLNGLQLTLNAGDDAGNRYINGQQGKDVGEHYEIRNANDPDDPNALVVTAFTVNEIHGNKLGVPLTIIANMGDARDVVVIGDTVKASAIIDGGDGDDLLVGGAGNDTLIGGDGNNHLIGGAGDDTLTGGSDDELFEGGLGADTINGGGGVDQITYEHSKAGISFKVDPNDSHLFRGTGGEAEGDRISNVEYIIGSHFNDQIYGNPSEDGTIEGLAGDDILIGGKKDDYILGGAGADYIQGGGGTNGTSYITSAGAINIDMLGNIGHGGDAEGDQLFNIQDIQGSIADDVITGNNDDNVIDGWYGDDRLAGGGGTDTITGGGGNDTIFGENDKGNDLDGGGSVYDKGQDLLTYERVTDKGVTVNLRDDKGHDNYARAVVHLAVDKTDTTTYADHISTFENLTGSKFADDLTGDDGYNVITGLGGNDTIKGMGGNDTLVGGTGADALDGGDGIDLADYRTSQGGVTAYLQLGLTSHSNDAEGDTIINVENLRGSDFNDSLFGDNGDNEIDPGLSRFGIIDTVSGGFGNDTLVLDYSRGDVGKGLVGGYALGSVSDGAFNRAEAASATVRDGVAFDGIERLNVTGTSKDDIILGGAGNDIISTGRGNDLIFTGLGTDRVYAGRGNDVVVSGTDANRNLSLAGGAVESALAGGDGIDTLSISLAAYKGNVVLTGTDGTSDFHGVNAVLANGTAISEFELLYAVFTDRGDDRITQPGTFANFIATGFGVDEIRPGLGADFVDGGMDYRIGTEIVEPDASGGLVPVKLIDAIYANDGDLLVLDYSNAKAAVTGAVGDAATPFTILDGSVARQIHTNDGHYASGTDAIDFINIERLDVTGSALNDTLVGTDLLLGRNVGPDGGIIASASARGDDRLVGGDGNDLLIGNTGDDTLIGGNGDDLLLGTAIGSARGAVVDRGEIDTLTGGDGADVFALGTVIDGRSIVYYDDGAAGAAKIGSAGDRTASGSNRAVITDFQAGDHLLMAGIASDYRSDEAGGTTRIYLRDGLDGVGAAAPKNDELIAELKGVTGFHLDSAAVYYVGTSVLAGAAVGADAGSLQVDGSLRVLADPGSMISARLADAAAAPAIVVRTPAAPSEALLVKPAPVAAPGLKSAALGAVGESWVTQTADPNDLRAALFDGPGPLAQGKFTIEGDAAAFGTFNGDPFGLGHGILLSTGQVEDLAGKNTVDGGTKVGPSTELTFVKIGSDALNTYYRADLTGLNFDLHSLKLVDKSGGIGGAGGSASGFDVNALALSHTRLDTLAPGADLNSAALLPRIDAFSLDAANVVFAPGTQRPASGGFINHPDLEGAVNGLPDFNKATLDTFDHGYLSLGDGGSLGFNLSQTVSTVAPLYLYVAERGANGETLSTGFTASSDRLDTPADLSTDLGVPGVEGDSIALSYTFTPGDAKGVPDNSINEVEFDFVFFSEELVEYAQSPFNDNFKITLNGVNMAQLSDGSFASVNTLYSPAANGDAASDIHFLRTDTINSDFIYNPAGTGPAADQTRADGYSKVLHFKGAINPGVANVLRIEVNDVRDGLLDSGVLIRGGSFIGHSVNDFFVDSLATPLLEGQSRDIGFGLHVPAGGHATGPLTVTLHPTAGLDLGAGAGHDVTRTLLAGGTLSDHVTATAISDGKNDGSRFEIVTVAVTGAGAPAHGIAPLVYEVDDALVAVARTIGDAPVRYSRSAPNAWADAWTATGVHTTHTADNTVRAPVYSAVNYGTLNPNLLSGSDILAGDLGVSGSVKGAPGGVQDIASREALKFQFDSGSVSAFSFDFARFTRGDSAKIDLLASDGHVIRSVTTTATTFGLDHLDHVAGIVVSAATGAFMIDSLSFTENLDPRLAAAFATDPHLDHVRLHEPVMMTAWHNDESFLVNQIA